MKEKIITSLKRATKLGWKNFHREGSISFVAVFVLMVAITFASFLFLLSGIAEAVIQSVEQKADVTVDFSVGVPEEKILEVREEIAAEFEVNDINYVSREESRNIFIERFGDRDEVMEALEEVGNPFPASLNIRADDSYVYGQISDYLEEEHGDLIYGIDFANREEVIEGIFSVTENIRRGGIIIGVVASLIAILLVYNTIRLTIYGLREEIKVMRLVGSSNLFIQGSFIIQGMIVGITAALTSFLVLFILGFMIPQSYNITLEVNLHQYFLEMIPMVLLLHLAIGIALGVFSSLIAIGKYLK